MSFFIARHALTFDHASPHTRFSSVNYIYAGSFWIRPEKDTEVDTLMHQATAPGTSGEETSIGYSSRPVQLGALVYVLVMYLGILCIASSLSDFDLTFSL